MLLLVPLLALQAVGVSIDHQRIDCMVQDRFASVDAVLGPAATAIVEARVYFRSPEELDFYYVTMTLTDDRFVAKLPKPQKAPGLVLYYIEAFGSEGTVRRTPQMSAQVVRRPQDCPRGGRLAEAAPKGDIPVFSTIDSNARPRGFGGVSSVALEARAGPKPAAPTSDATQTTALSNESDYTIGPEDILRINVYGHEDLPQVVVVQEDGTLPFPFIGRITAEDLTARELEEALALRLSQGFIRNPQVTVVVEEYRSKTVFVVGEVSRPGTYALSGSMTVMEMLAKAGPAAGAGTEVVIVRPLVEVTGPVLPQEVVGEGGPEPGLQRQAEIIRVNIRDIQRGRLDQNVTLRPNDTVFVAPAPRFFVLGEVRSPGAFPFEPGLTVRQAISMAGGFSPDASTSRIRIIREVDGNSKEVKVDLDDLFRPGETIIVKARLF
jgi:polysaccharide export outer membrane protein